MQPLLFIRDMALFTVACIGLGIVLHVGKAIECQVKPAAEMTMSGARWCGRYSPKASKEGPNQ